MFSGDMRVKNEKKRLLLQLLQEQGQALSLAQILSYLGDDSPERTVRRWLQEFVQLGLAEKQGQKKSTQYRARVSASHATEIFSQASLVSLAYVNQPLFKRSPKSYHFEWLEAYQPNITFYLSVQQREHLKSLGQRDHSHDIAGTYARKIYHRLLIDLSYHSSRLEGNTYSRLDTEKLVIEGVENPLKLDEEKVMILNHKEAIRYLVDNIAKIVLDEDAIYTLHYLLSEGLVLVSYSGKVRDHAVRVSSSTYITLEGVAPLQNQLKIICEKARKILDPYEQSFFLLTHIAYLQAFSDVNKRTSRLSANISLIKNNLVPLSFNDINKDDYISAILSVYELNDTGPLSELYVFSYERTCQEYSATLDVLGFDEVRIRYRRERREIMRYIILNQLKGNILTDYIAQQALAVVPENLQKDFIDDIKEDLQHISPVRIAGLGITTEDLRKWLDIL